MFSVEGSENEIQPGTILDVTITRKSGLSASPSLFLFIVLVFNVIVAINFVLSITNLISVDVMYTNISVSRS